MKKILLKTFLLIIISSLILSFPLKLCSLSINKYIQYHALRELSCFSLETTTESVQFSAFYGNDAQSNAHNYIKSIQDTPGVESTHIFNTNTNLITYLYTDVTDLKYKTVVEQVGRDDSIPINYRKLVVENSQGYQVSNSGTIWNENVLNIGSYEIPEMFVKTDYLKCTEGRYPDLELEYQNNETVEIMVTSGLGLNVGDSCYIALDAIDKNDELVVMKATVVGIASKGIFLPYYDRYFSGDASTVDEAYNRIFNGEMIYYPNLSKCYTYNSHFKPEEENAHDKTTVTMILVDKNMTSHIENILKEYDGVSISQKVGLFNSSKNVYELRTFVNYEDVAYFDSFSIAQTEVAFSICLLVFVLFYIITVAIKIISMIKKHRTTNLIQGDKQ